MDNKSPIKFTSSLSWAPDQDNKPKSAQPKVPEHLHPQASAPITEAKLVDGETKDNPKTSATSIAARKRSRWSSNCYVYMQHTGRDFGKRCEMRGHLKTSTGYSQKIENDLTVETDFRGENEGAGRMIASFYAETWDFPPSFDIKLYEEGDGWMMGDVNIIDQRIYYNSEFYPNWQSGYKYRRTYTADPGPYSWNAMITYTVWYLGEWDDSS